MNLLATRVDVHNTGGLQFPDRAQRHQAILSLGRCFRWWLPDGVQNNRRRSSSCVHNWTKPAAPLAYRKRVTVRSVAFICDENAITRSRLLAEKERAMPERRRFKQTETLERRFLDEAARFRKQAQSAPPGIDRKRLLRLALQAETASHSKRHVSEACP